MERATRFYSQILPALGFSNRHGDEQWQTFYSAQDGKPAEFFGFTVDPDHQPNGTRIAFWADARQEVDRFAELVRKAGGGNLEGPELCVDYSPGYYAFFFEDPDGNKLEICCRATEPVAE